MTVYRLPRLVLLLSLFFCVLHPAHVQHKKCCTVITMTGATDHCKKMIEKEFPEPFLVESIDLTADVYVDKDELSYLIGFEAHQVIDASMLYKALVYLFKKNVFESIELTATKGATEGLRLLFKFTALWALRDITVKGLWFGRDAYKNYYGLEPGDPFDITRHKDSLNAIREILHSEGFFQASVTDNLEYIQASKEVSVQLCINKGAQFRLSLAKVNVHADKSDAMQKTALYQEIMTFLQKRISGKYYTKDLLNKETASLKQMLVHKGFVHADITLVEESDVQKQQLVVVFDIELHEKKEFIFFGNTFFSNKQLMDVIMAFGRSAWLVPPSILAQELEAYYQNNGFWDVAVQDKQEVGRVFFVVHEGQRAVIKEIVLDGVRHTSAQALVENYMSSSLLNRPFDERTVKSATELLITYYRDQGYFDATITGPTHSQLADGTGYKLVFVVHEGERRFVRSVCLAQLDAKRLECPYIVDIDAGKKIYCTTDVVEAQRRWMSGCLHDNKVRIRHECKEDGVAVDLVWHIDAAQPSGICGKTVLVGTRTLPFAVIQRELCYKPSDPLVSGVIKKSLINIRALDIFDSVSIFPDQTNELGCERPIVLKVSPGDMFELRTHAGIGLQQMRWPFAFDGLAYKAGGAFVVRNPTHSGDQAVIELGVTRIRTDVSARYKRPWIFGLPIDSMFAVYSNKFKQQGFFCDRQNWYEVHQSGFLANLVGNRGRLDYSMNAGIEWMRINVCKPYRSIEDEIMRAYKFDRRLLDNYIPYFFIEPTCMFDYLDEKLNPASGSFTLFSCKAMASMRDSANLNVSFLKFFFEQTYYKSLYSITMALRLRAGYIVGPPIEQIFLNERFYLGGAHSLRSYYTDGTPPLGSFEYCNGTHYVPQGGKAMFNATCEFRIPVYAGFQGIIFQDIGALSHRYFKDVRQHGLLAGTGFGALRNTPLGQLSFTIGWKWSCKKPFDRSYAWFLSLGQVF